MEYVPPGVFAEDYLYFYADWLNDELSDAQTELIWTALGLAEEDEVLDVPCGHGRIANRLAARGARVTGIDADGLFLRRARDDAAARGVDVDYVEATCASCPGRSASTSPSTGSRRSGTSTTGATGRGSRPCGAP